MNKPLILCVEDNDNDIVIMQRIFNLKLKEFDVCFHTNVDDSKVFLNEALNNKLPAMAIVDIKLINSNGLDLLKYMKTNSIFKNIPVIMLSSSDRKDDKRIAEEYGCNEYVEKPKNYIHLKTRLPEIVSNWHNKIG